MTFIKAKVISVADESASVLAVEQITAGEVIVVPTDTIYGLTADAENEAAVKRLYSVKGRELDRPSAIFLGSIAAIARYAQIEHEYADRIIRKFLPGPLTVVLKSRITDLPGVVTRDGKVGIRVSADAFVRTLVDTVGSPLIATSANRSGQPDPQSSEELIKLFAKQVPLILTKDDSINTIATTVVDLSEPEPRLIREGTIHFADLLKTGDVTN
jgi:L-threonylcarbamoyladenylate synthase